MPVFSSSDQLYSTLQDLFSRVQVREPTATQTVEQSRLILRMKLTNPAAIIVINGRLKPPKILYGSSTLRPDLDVEMPADAFHRIMLAELPLGKAVTGGQLKFRGAVTKSFALQDLFHHGQAIYVEVLREQGIDGYKN